MIDYKLKDGFLVIKDNDGFSRLSICDIQGVYPNENMVTFSLINNSEWEYKANTCEEAEKVSGDIAQLLYDRF